MREARRIKMRADAPQKMRRRKERPKERNKVRSFSEKEKHRTENAAISEKTDTDVVWFPAMDVLWFHDRATSVRATRYS